MSTTETLIVYIDDAAYAQQQLAPMLDGQPTRWVLVACAPRMTRRIGKWLSHSARENWRDKWCDKLFSQVAPALRQGGSRVECIVATGPLPEFTQQLRQDFGVARVIDARRPKFGHEMPPVTPEQPRTDARWQMPAALGSLGAVMVLAAE